MWYSSCRRLVASAMSGSALYDVGRDGPNHMGGGGWLRRGEGTGTEGGSGERVP